MVNARQIKSGFGRRKSHEIHGLPVRVIARPGDEPEEITARVHYKTGALKIGADLASYIESQPKAIVARYDVDRLAINSQSVLSVELNLVFGVTTIEPSDGEFYTVNLKRYDRARSADFDYVWGVP